MRKAKREVRLSSADRVLFPDDGITKGDLFAYYEQAAPSLLPHLRDRPFTMKRYPHGIDGEVFFQKQAPKHLPNWIPTRQFRTWPRKGTASGGADGARTSSDTASQPTPWRLVDFALVNSV